MSPALWQLCCYPHGKTPTTIGIPLVVPARYRTNELTRASKAVHNQTPFVPALAVFKNKMFVIYSATYGLFFYPSQPAILTLSQFPKPERIPC